MSVHQPTVHQALVLETLFAMAQQESALILTTVELELIQRITKDVVQLSLLKTDATVLMMEVVLIVLTI